MTVADFSYRTIIEAAEREISRWGDSIYLGSFARYTFSGRATTVEEEVLTSIRDCNEGTETHIRTARFLLAMFHLQDVSESPPDSLSGGEAQRLALLLACIVRNRPIIIDHALSEQDSRHARLLSIFLGRFSVLLDIPILYRRAASELRGAKTFERSVCGNPPLLHGMFQLRSRRRIICDVSRFCLYSGAVNLVVGDNGTGKSLFLRYLMGELPHGITGGGEANWVGGAPPAIGYVGQDPTLGFSFATTRTELAAASRAALEAFREAPHVRGADLEASPFELTVDKQKLLATAKCLHWGRGLVLLDEPSEYWDSQQLEYVQAMLRSFVSADGTVVVATHDTRLMVSAHQVLDLGTRDSTNDAQPRRPLSKRAGPHLRSRAPYNMYGAWRRLHDVWPGSTLELFENWHRHVDDVLGQQIERISAARNRVSLLDLGCGNGLQTLWLRAKLRSEGIEVSSTQGIDWQDRAIDWATYWSEFLPDVNFRTAEITESLRRAADASSASLLTSLFVLHDLPEAETHLHLARDALADGGFYLCCFLNPQWVEERAEALFGGGAALELPHDAVFAREYLLPESSDEPLGLPYFHRTVAWYEQAFRRAGFQDLTIAYGSTDVGSDSGAPQTVSFLAATPD